MSGSVTSTTYSSPLLLAAKRQQHIKTDASISDGFRYIGKFMDLQH